MFFLVFLGIVQIGRAFAIYYADRLTALPADTAVIGFLCLALAEVIRRQNRAEGMGDEEKEVVPNRPHPLARPHRARPSVPALPSDK